ncbi:MAG: bifunctional folylpolyglutamate synthase/dihydrofolate synthase [Candidatus Woesearchaeota archaeon]
MVSKFIEEVYALSKVLPRDDLSEFEKILAYYDNPQRSFSSALVLGTNGKGSTSQYFSSILAETGRKIGLFTSPHLFSYTERMKVNDREISVARIESYIEDIFATMKELGVSLSFFECTTLIAFRYFKDEGVDFAVIETGLGGKLDPTSIIKPELYLLTNIDKDHQEFFGETYEKIVKSELEILRPNIPVFCGEDRKNIQEIISEYCQQKHIPLRFVLDTTRIILKEKKESLNKQEVMYEGEYTGSLMLQAGEYQQRNALLAIIGAHFFNVSSKNIQQGVSNVYIRGRMEYIQQNPLILVDGAHNELGLSELVKELQKLPRPITLIYGQSKSGWKKYIAQDIISSVNSCIFTQGEHKAESAQDLFARFGSEKSYVKKDVKDAIIYAKEITPKTGSICITGSLYMISLALSELKHDI